jgi:hypothetical protein
MISTGWGGDGLAGDLLETKPEERSTMQRLIVMTALLLSMAGSAHAALFGLIPTERSVRLKALEAGHSPVAAHQLAHQAMQCVGQRILNRHGINALINTGNIQTGLSVTRQTRVW